VIRHVSMLTFTPGVTAAQVRAVEAALARLPAHLPMRAYSFGTDAGIDDGNATFAVVADFDDRDGYVAYRDDPEHRRIIAELIRPILATRAAAQYEVEE
jgi:hypothetical protein